MFRKYPLRSSFWDFLSTESAKIASLAKYYRDACDMNESKHTQQCGAGEGQRRKLRKGGEGSGR